MQPVQQSGCGNSFCGCFFPACVKLFLDQPLESYEKDEYAYQLLQSACLGQAFAQTRTSPPAMLCSLLLSLNI